MFKIQNCGATMDMLLCSIECAFLKCFFKSNKHCSKLLIDINFRPYVHTNQQNYVLECSPAKLVVEFRPSNQP